MTSPDAGARGRAAAAPEHARRPGSYRARARPGAPGAPRRVRQGGLCWPEQSPEDTDAAWGEYPPRG